MFLCEVQIKHGSTGIWVLEKHASDQSVLFLSHFSVCISYLGFPQVYKSIFTSPSSAKNILEEENTAENLDMPPTKSQKTSSNNSVRRNVASKLHLNDKVTPRSVAYAAVQVWIYVIVSYVVQVLRLSMTASSISTCKLQVHGLQFTVDLTTRDCTTTSSISSKTPQGLLQKNAPKNYSTGGQCELPSPSSDKC